MSKWEKYRFDEVIFDDTKKGVKIKQSDYLQEGLYPVIDQGKEKISGYTNRCEGIYTSVPAIIFGDHTRVIKYIDTPFFLGADGVKILRLKRDDVLYKYLYYFLLKNEIPDTGYNRHFKWLKELSIPICSLEEQKLIVDILDYVKDLISFYEQQLTELDNLIKSIFYDMFGDPVVNEKSWDLYRIEDVCAKIYGGGTPTKKNKEYYQGNIPWVTPKDMKSIRIKNSTDQITELAIQNSSAKLVPPKSVLMVIRSGILKRTLPVAINEVEVALNQDMKAFIPKNDAVADYLLYFFIAMEKNILKHVRGVTADNIEFNMIKNLNIPLPPLSLQNEFARIVEKIEEQKAQVRKAIDEAQMLFDSLMSKYFDD